MKIKTILLDIEGTTTPIDFVHKTLFPYAKERVNDFVADNLDALRAEIEQLKTEYKKDFSEQIYGRDFRADKPETVAEYLKFLIEIDRKSTALKSIQGMIWQKGYASGELESVVFEDVPRAFKRWKREGKTVAIYSSGSRQAQQLLFKHTNHGDLTPLIAAYFDTNAGSKKESRSYQKIAESLQVAANEIVFISDILEELSAARRADLNALLAVRQGNAPVKDDHDYQKVFSFDSL